MSKWIHGKAVQHHKVKFLSASSLQKADGSTSTGCLRAWHYQYIGGIKEPQSAAMKRGIELHAELEKYMTTGERGHLSSLALSGLHMVPDPGDDLLVEHSMVPIGESGEEDLALAPVRIVDTPVLGKIDVMHARGINKGASDVASTRDPEGTVEVIDWKSTSNINNAKAASELVETIQMSLYGKYVYAVAPDTKLVRLSHGYFPTKGRPCKVTALVDQEAIERSWKRTLAVGVSIRDAARETNPDKVDANTRACRAYGRDCPAMSVCRAASHNSLASLVGSAASRIVPHKSLPIIQSNEPMTTPVAANNLFAKLQAAKSGQPAPTAPAPTAPAPTAPAPTAPAPTAPAPEAVAAEAVAAEVARLAAIDAAANASPSNPLLALIAEIEAYGFGMVQFNGQAARDVAAAKGIKLSSGAGLAGTGEMGSHAVDNVEVLPTILAGVKELAALRSQAPATEVSTETEQPQKAEETVEEKSDKKTKAKKASTKKTSSKKADKDASHETATTEGGAESVTINISTMNVSNASSTNAPAPAPESPKQSDEPKPGPTPQPPGAINVYVDVAVEGIELTSLWPIVHFIQQNMNNDAAACEEGVSDFRTSMQKDSRYAFGKWPGILAAALRQCPSEGYMPPGNYRLDGSMGQIGGVVCETMREIALATGGIFVKGAR